MKEANETGVMSETEITDESAATGTSESAATGERPVRGELASPDEQASAKSLTLSCVILTMGDRPAEVNRAIDSVLAQRGPQVELVVVGNGTEVTGLPPGVKTVSLPENVGVAAG